MSIPIVINGTTYSLPEQGQLAPWGEDLSALIEALANSVNTFLGPADILLTTFNVANNVTSATNVTGAAFDPSQVRSAILSYSIYRSTSSTEAAETGQLLLTYKTQASAWDLAQTFGSASGVTFTITAGGQIQYTSSNLGGTGYVGLMRFSAKAFLQ